jgi:hypothetical protein
LLLFNQFGDLERCLLRPGNVHGADDWRTVLEPVIARYPNAPSTCTSMPTRRLPSPSCTKPWKPRTVKYAIRLPANRLLLARIGHP